jgi:peptide/nickel transport system permease protein
MDEVTAILPLRTEAPIRKRVRTSALFRLGRYTILRIITLFATVIVGTYLTILIANMGGYVDRIQRGQIQEAAQQSLLNDPSYRMMTPDARLARLEETITLQERQLGLNQPFLVRSFRYLSNALTLSLGRAQKIISDSGSKEVRLILLERLPSTLVLFASANILLFFSSIFIALHLSRRYGGLLDRIIVGLSPSSSAPGWFYGIFLILIFAALLKVLPFGGMVVAPPPKAKLDYALSLLKHLILPVSAIVISAVFQNIYAWRTFFLIYSSEDYVEMAKAKGLTSRSIERRYVLRPTLPTIVTNFTLTLIGLWLGAPILETVFNWPGLGRTTFTAIGQFDTPVIVGANVLFAYLLAITVFLLDFVYALVDPRVKIGGEGKSS